MVAWQHNPAVHERLKANGKAVVSAAMRKLVHNRLRRVEIGQAAQSEISACMMGGKTVYIPRSFPWFVNVAHCAPILWCRR